MSEPWKSARGSKNAGNPKLLTTDQVDRPIVSPDDAAFETFLFQRTGTLIRGSRPAGELHVKWGWL